jgi:hypothetical protein
VLTTSFDIGQCITSCKRGTGIGSRHMWPISIEDGEHFAAFSTKLLAAGTGEHHCVVLGILAGLPP